MPAPKIVTLSNTKLAVALRHDKQRVVYGGPPHMPKYRLDHALAGHLVQLSLDLISICKWDGPRSVHGVRHGVVSHLYFIGGQVMVLNGPDAVNTSSNSLNLNLRSSGSFDGDTSRRLWLRSGDFQNVFGIILRQEFQVTAEEPRHKHSLLLRTNIGVCRDRHATMVDSQFHTPIDSIGRPFAAIIISPPPWSKLFICSPERRRISRLIIVARAPLSGMAVVLVCWL